MEAFIQIHGVTKCPPRTAAGAGWYKPTAAGYGTPDSFLHRESTAKCNEENLAKAKILTMLEDLGGRAKGIEGNPAAKMKVQNDAYRWFFDSRMRRDFEAWCDTAGYDPDYVREQAQKIRETGLPEWRAAPGKGARYEERKAYREKKGK